MKYSRFEDLPVWKAAIDFGVRAFTLVDDPAFARLGDARNQLQRASLSISNNVAEGFERGTTNETLMFLYIAKGSAGECRSVLRFCDRLPALTHLKSQISDLIPLAESISRQLHGWATSLKNSDIPGVRHLTDESRARYDQTRRAEQFLAHLRELQASRLPAAE